MKHRFSQFGRLLICLIHGHTWRYYEEWPGTETRWCPKCGKRRMVKLPPAPRCRKYVKRKAG